MDNEKDNLGPSSSVSRREFVGVAATGTAVALGAGAQVVTEAQVVTGSVGPTQIACNLTINGKQQKLQVDPRTTLLDLLREHLQMTGTKKGCDHGQCGACTVMVNGRRINSCLSLAVMNDGNEITTIEGLAQGGELHPMQAAFVENDGLQCGYCTPGQICSAAAMLQEVKQGAPSAVTPHLAQITPIDLTDAEIRERMSGNLCRCAAYVGIVDAIRQVAKESRA